MRHFLSLVIMLALPLGVSAEQTVALESERIQELKRQIAQASIGSHDLTIIEKDGNVTLQGQVVRSQDRERVQQAIKDVGWVRSIDNQISVVRRARFGEDRVLDTARERLQRSDIGAHSIEMRHSGDTLTVAGTVESREDRDIVIDTLRDIPGVGRVEDNLTITVPDSQMVMQRVDGILRGMNASRQVTANMQEGELILNGNMRSRPEVDLLLSKVLMVPGVSRIKSDITVNGQPYLSQNYLKRIESVG